MKMNLRDRYQDAREHFKIDSVIFYSSKPHYIECTQNRDDVYAFGMDLKRIYDFEIEYKQDNKTIIKNTADIPAGEKSDYINISNYSAIKKTDFMEFTGNIRIIKKETYFKTYFMFIDIANLEKLTDSCTKYQENRFIEYWCKCKIIALQKELFIKIPYYSQSFTKLKKEYFKLALLNRIINNNYREVTEGLTYDRAMNYTELKSYSCNWAVDDIFKYSTIEILKELLKNKEAFNK